MPTACTPPSAPSSAYDLTLVVPCRSAADAGLHTLLGTVDAQTFPRERLELLVCTEGSSEAARNAGIRRAQGRIIGCLDADNWLPDSGFLRRLFDAADAPGVCGAYPAHYAYRRSDPSLTRYFALLGANDPLAWWLGKADRHMHLRAVASHTKTFDRRIPTLGSNGFFVKRACIVSYAHADAGHIDVCEAMRRAGHAAYTVTTDAIGHATGTRLDDYLRRRLCYGRTHYWRRLGTRTWRMVASPRDWLHVGTFVLASVCLLPHLWVCARGLRRTPDPAWLWHLVVPSALTLVYAWLLIEYLVQPLWSAPINARRP